MEFKSFESRALNHTLCEVRLNHEQPLVFDFPQKGDSRTTYELDWIINVRHECIFCNFKDIPRSTEGGVTSFFEGLSLRAELESKQLTALRGVHDRFYFEWTAHSFPVPNTCLFSHRNRIYLCNTTLSVSLCLCVLVSVRACVYCLCVLLSVCVRASNTVTAFGFRRRGS